MAKAYRTMMASGQATLPGIEVRDPAAVKLEEIGAVAHRPMPPLPSGPYNVIVADPPWDLQMGMRRRARRFDDALPYPTMTVEEIAALPVADLLADDAWVFLWIVDQYHWQSRDVLEAWGAEFQDFMYWIKSLGMKLPGGPYRNCETVLVGRRGQPTWTTTKDFQTAFCGKHPGGHSAKPVEFYDILRRVTVGRRLDLFSRRRHEGFDGWGKESA